MRRAPALGRRTGLRDSRTHGGSTGSGGRRQERSFRVQRRKQGGRGRRCGHQRGRRLLAARDAESLQPAGLALGLRWPPFSGRCPGSAAASGARWPAGWPGSRRKARRRPAAGQDGQEMARRWWGSGDWRQVRSGAPVWSMVFGPHELVWAGGKSWAARFLGQNRD